MNKYALGTIVGTSLLGFLKSKLGSGIRLKLVPRMQFRYSIRLDFEEVYELEKWKNWLPSPLFYENFFNEHSDIFSPVLKNINGHFLIEEDSDDDMVLDIVVSGLLNDEDYEDTDNIEENIYDWMYGYALDFTYEFERYLNNNFGMEIEDTVIFDQEFEEDYVTVDADTGEEYKPPESRISKLRKR